MSFANPSAFLLLLILAAVIWLREGGRFHFRARLPFPDLTLARGVPATWRARFRRWPVFLIYAGLALGIIALARPRALLRGAESRARGIDIMITLDTSGSMRALDFKPQNRMDVARRATRTFIAHRQADRIGLVVFAGVSLLQCPLTLDYGALLEFLEQVEVGMTATENTAIGTAIATASNHLKRSAAKSKVIILVTDGRSNAGEVDPLTAARAADALGIRIYTIGVGIRGRSVIPVDTVWGRQLVPIEEDLDEPTLEQIARLTQGRYYRAASSKEFEKIYAEIDQLERTELKSAPPQEYQDRYLGWLLAAMVLLTAAIGLELTVFRTIP